MLDDSKNSSLFPFIFKQWGRKRLLQDATKGWQTPFVSHRVGIRLWILKTSLRLLQHNSPPGKTVWVTAAPFPTQSQHSFFYSSALYLKVIKKLLPCLKINSEASEKVESLLLILYDCYKKNPLFFFFRLFTLQIHQECLHFAEIFVGWCLVALIR